MDYSSKTKMELLELCNNLGIIKCKSKNKSQLIQLINSKTPQPSIEIVIIPKNEEITENVTTLHKI